MKKYVDKDKLQEFATKLHNKQKTIFATQESIAPLVGSPLVASTAAEMTDTDKIYVYVGSETGYTAGNWYYYNGSAWTSGGVYNSAGFVLDDTLTDATKPAQAKAVGDAIGKVESDIIDLQSAVDNCFNFVVSENLFNKDSTLIVNGFQLSYSSVATLSGSSYTHPIPIVPGQEYSFMFSGSYYGDSANRIVRYCKSDGTLGDGQNAVVNTDSGGTKFGTFTALDKGEDYHYICVNVRTTLISTFMFVAGDSIPSSYVSYFDPHYKMDDSVEFSDEQNDLIDNKIKNDSLIVPHNVVNGKYVYWHNGTIDSNNSYKYIDIYVFPGNTLKYKYTNNNPNVVGLVFLDKNNSYISGVQAIATEQTITIPDGAFICRASVTDVSQIEYYYTPLPAITSYLYNHITTAKYSVLEAFDNISCFGDSLTYGVVYTGSSTSRRSKSPYPETLGKITGATIANVSEGGITASGWWTKYNAEITSKSNQLIIIYLGTNGGLTDTLSTDAPEDTDYSTWADTNTGAYAKIVAKAQSVGAKVLLIKLYETNAANDVIEQIAERFGCGIVENYRLTDNVYHYWPNLNGTNTVHYNDLGYVAFAHYLIDQITKMHVNYLKYLIPN